MREITVTEREQGKGVFKIFIDVDDLAISKTDVVRALGYRDGAIPEHFDALIDRILPHAPQRCAINAGYRVLDIRRPDHQNDGFYAGKVFFTTQKIIAARMKKAERAACFICTIGPDMERWAGQLVSEGDTVMGHLVDTVATVAVEGAVDRVHDHLKKKMLEQGLHVTNRYSPGYCGWPVWDQHALFSLFPKGFCGVTLTESALMKPVKSVSGVIGIGPKVAFAGYDCDACAVNDCIYRAYRVARKSVSQRMDL